jgi:hypothetical protein
MNKKYLFSFIAVIILFITIVPIFAEVKEIQTVENIENAQTEVTYTQDSSFMVIIPKKIVLESTKMSNYNVTVIGNISSAGKVTVVPEESFLMKDKSSIVNVKPDVETFVTQDKTEWFWNEILENSNIKGYGNIYAENISAGTWEGSFWFNIQYKNINLLSVEKENYSVVGTNSFNINVENPSNGELSAISSDTSIATVNVIDNVLTINPIKVGTVTITII